MSRMFESFASPPDGDHLEERMAQIKEDPSLKPILEEIETGGLPSMLKSGTFKILNMNSEPFSFLHLIQFTKLCSR